jgi:UDP:flavonoid glycosyltransferase YjiC (YdhE family)
LLSPWTLRLAVRRALADATIGAAARRIASADAAGAGARRAADLVQELALRRRRPGWPGPS